jgi:CRP-like cAMP-binding protein
VPVPARHRCRAACHCRRAARGRAADDHRESLLAFVEPYQWLGEISFIDGQPRSHDVVADGATTVLLVPQAELQDWLDARTHWRSLVAWPASSWLMFSAFEDIAQLPLELRLASGRLVAQGYGGRTGGPRRLIRLPQEQLALLLGVSRRTINKARTRWSSAAGCARATAPSSCSTWRPCVPSPRRRGGPGRVQASARPPASP